MLHERGASGLSTFTSAASENESENSYATGRTGVYSSASQEHAPPGRLPFGNMTLEQNMEKGVASGPSTGKNKCGKCINDNRLNIHSPNANMYALTARIHEKEPLFGNSHPAICSMRRSKLITCRSLCGEVSHHRGAQAVLAAHRTAKYPLTLPALAEFLGYPLPHNSPSPQSCSSEPSRYPPAHSTVEQADPLPTPALPTAT